VPGPTPVFFNRRVAWFLLTPTDGQTPRDTLPYAASESYSGSLATGSGAISDENVLMAKHDSPSGTAGIVVAAGLMSRGEPGVNVMIESGERNPRDWWLKGRWWWR